MTTVAEHLPIRPRRPSSARRRRHLAQLAYRIHLIVPTAHTVLLTPVSTTEHGDPEVVFMALVRDVRGQALKLPSGGSRQLAVLIRGAHPSADWSCSQTWRADTSTLTPVQTVLGRAA